MYLKIKEISINNVNIERKILSNNVVPDNISSLQMKGMVKISNHELCKYVDIEIIVKIWKEAIKPKTNFFNKSITT